MTVLIALVAHKWVESIALSARCVKAGANWWCARLPEAAGCLAAFSERNLHACMGLVATTQAIAS